MHRKIGEHPRNGKGDDCPRGEVPLRAPVQNDVVRQTRRGGSSGQRAGWRASSKECATNQGPISSGQSFDGMSTSGMVTILVSLSLSLSLLLLLLLGAGLGGVGRVGAAGAAGAPAFADVWTLVASWPTVSLRTPLASTAAAQSAAATISHEETSPFSFFVNRFMRAKVRGTRTRWKGDKSPAIGVSPALSCALRTAI